MKRLSILDQLWRYEIPFLVIEPFKSEYRHFLLGTERFKAAGQVFTPGSEQISPCCLNPFEIKKGISVNAHIAALIKIFADSFKMTEGMKQSLEVAVNQIYIAKSWELDLNKNVRLSDSAIIECSDCPDDIFPTMDDLLKMIQKGSGKPENPVLKVGASDSQAALESIISSLLLGDKGKIFNARRSIKPEILFGRPAVVELKCIPDDSEKMFFAELLLLQLCQYRKYQSSNNGLAHITVFEDAHLLSSASGKEPFLGDFLSEAQALGVGLIMVDQSPLKLSKVVPMANLKIMHRVVSSEDINCVARAMNLDDIQRRHLTALGQGVTIVSSGEFELPFLLSIKLDRAFQFAQPDDQELGDQMVLDAMKKTPE